MKNKYIYIHYFVIINILVEKPSPKPSKPAASQDSQEEAEESAPVAAPAPASKGFNKPNSACKLKN